MKIIADLHTHTSVSTHALSTLNEMVAQAQVLGLKTIAITDHAPAMPDAPHPWYFNSLLRLPHTLPNGFLLLKGVEADVVDLQGTLDMDTHLLKKMDWVIVSMHQGCIAPMGFEQATALWLKIAENPLVDMIGHSEQEQFLYDYEYVTKAFAANNKVVEINANSPLVRPRNEENMRRLALACKNNGTKIAVNSDAHSIFGLGNADTVLPLLQEIDFPEELIINSSVRQLAEELERHGKPVASLVRQLPEG